MISWKIEEMPCGHGVLTLVDKTTGIEFVLMFPDIDRLRRFLDAMADSTKCAACDAGLEAMSDFVEAFPERF